MATFEVKVETRGYEIYQVDAENEAEARENYWNGEMVHSEVTSVEDILRVEEVED